LRIDGKRAHSSLAAVTSLLESHYVRKLRGRREILEGGEDDEDEEEEEEEEEGGGEATSLPPRPDHNDQRTPSWPRHTTCDSGFDS
jgi:hypothetical protein